MMNHPQPQVTGQLLAAAMPYYGSFLDLYGVIDPCDGHYIECVAVTGTTADISELINAIPGQLDRMAADLDRKAYGVITALRIESRLDAGQYRAEELDAA